MFMCKVVCMQSRGLRLRVYNNHMCICMYVCGERERGGWGGGGGEDEINDPME